MTPATVCMTELVQVEGSRLQVANKVYCCHVYILPPETAIIVGSWVLYALSKY